MSERFFCDSPIEGTEAVLAGPEAHHLLHVMRAQVGDRVTLLDGSGAEFDAEVLAVGRREASLAILSRSQVNRESSCELILGVALPKGDRQKVLVEKLTELGAARLIPLVTARSQAAPKANALEKLRRQVVEACKQCGRNTLMRIEEPTPLDGFLTSDWGEARRWLAHPLDSADGAAELSDRVVAAVGPEGGFDDSEVELARSLGWQGVSLGPRVLRIETAAIAIAALSACRLG